MYVLCGVYNSKNASIAVHSLALHMGTLLGMVWNKIQCYWPLTRPHYTNRILCQRCTFCRREYDTDKGKVLLQGPTFPFS